MKFYEAEIINPSPIDPHPVDVVRIKLDSTIIHIEITQTNAKSGFGLVGVDELLRENVLYCKNVFPVHL